MSDDTLLEISAPGIPTYSARGLTQTLDPIEAAGAFARSVNGDLIDLSPPQMRKYKSTISCRDVAAPAFDGVWPGDTITVDCVPELGYITAGGSPQRTVVVGSERIEDSGWTYYRPEIVFTVISYTVSRDEWGGVTDWQLQLEET